MDEETPAARLRLALNMAEFGIGMQRARLRRLNPDAGELQIDAALQDWLVSRPEAPFGDAVGRPSTRFA